MGVLILRSVPAGSAPVNTSAPVVSGTAREGSTLSCSTGSWDNEPTSYSYQWYYADGDVAIIGATSSSYLVQAGDVGEEIYCVVTATNAGGSSSQDSNTVGPVEESAPIESGDIYSHDFAGGSKGGLFTWGDPEPAVVADATSASGYSLRYQWQSGYENYNGAFYTFGSSPARKHVYVRIRYKKQAGASISGIQKQLRFRGTIDNGANEIAIGTVNTQSSRWRFGENGSVWDSPSDSDYGPARSVGEWVWLEALLDFRTAGRLIFKLWCDGELVIDVDDNNPSGNANAGTQNPNFRMHGIMFLGTYNGPADSRYDWISRIDVGTEFMGVP